MHVVHGDIDVVRVFREELRPKGINTKKSYLVSNPAACDSKNSREIVLLGYGEHFRENALLVLGE